MTFPIRNKRVLPWGMPLRIALIGCYLAACFLAIRLGYRTVALLLPFCLMGGTSAWILWRHYWRGEPQEGVKQHRFVVVLSALMIVSLPGIPHILDWLSAD